MPKYLKSYMVCNANILDASRSYQCHSQNAEKVTHIEGRLLLQVVILFIASLFKIGTSHKGNTLLPEGANSSLNEQFLIVRIITFTSLGDIP